MGNSASWSARLIPHKNEILFDLSQLGAYLPYNIDYACGEFYLHFNLGRRSILIPDFASLARSDTPVEIHIEVEEERKIRIPYRTFIPPHTYESFRNGVSRPIFKNISEWRPIQLLETELGMIVIEAQVIVDVFGILKLEEERPFLLHRERLLLVGSTDGFVKTLVRARFEAGLDRSDVQLKTNVRSLAFTLLSPLYACNPCLGFVRDL